MHLENRAKIGCTGFGVCGLNGPGTIERWSWENKEQARMTGCDQKGQGAYRLVYLHGQHKGKEREVQNMHGTKRSESELEIQILSNTFRGRNQ